jgi:ABC-type microcin C transport system permease subunit YejB
MKLHFAYFCIAFMIIPLAMGTDLNRSVRGLESSPKSSKKKDTKGMGSNEEKASLPRAKKEKENGRRILLQQVARA